jgi:hypothetical protein
MSRKREIRWLPRPEAHNYPAARSYLSLFNDEPTVNRLLQELRRASISRFKSKDIFRASRLSLLGVSNSQLQRDRKKIKSGTPLSPLLLVRDQVHQQVIIADGYHRLCAVYTFDEDAEIPCKIV